MMYGKHHGRVSAKECPIAVMRPLCIQEGYSRRMRTTLQQREGVRSGAHGRL